MCFGGARRRARDQENAPFKTQKTVRTKKRCVQKTKRCVQKTMRTKNHAYKKQNGAYKKRNGAFKKQNGAYKIRTQSSTLQYVFLKPRNTRRFGKYEPINPCVEKSVFRKTKFGVDLVRSFTYSSHIRYGCMHVGKQYNFGGLKPHFLKKLQIF